LDQVLDKIQELEQELSQARQREEQIREWMAEVSRLSREKEELEESISHAERDYRAARYCFLRDITSTAHEISANISRLDQEMAERAWAKDLPPGCEESLEDLSGGIEKVEERIKETGDELGRLLAKKDRLLDQLKGLGDTDNLGVDESGVAALYSRYLSAKANSSRGERLANEARKEMAKLEEEGRVKGLAGKKAGEDLLKRAEEYQDILILCEKEKDKLNLEVEKQRSRVASINVGGTTGWIYTLALGVLAVAVVMTFMGVPLAGWATFGISLLVFGIGAFRHRKFSLLKGEEEKRLSEEELRLKEQEKRVEEARKVLTEFLGTMGVKSLEELRSVVREVTAYEERLKRAKEKYELTHSYWFEASTDLSTVEKEIIKVLRISGCLSASEPLTEEAVDRLVEKLKEVSGLKQEISGLESREKDLRELMVSLEERRTRLMAELNDLLVRAGVTQEAELKSKIEAGKEYREALRRKNELEERLRTLLSGRAIEDFERELSTIEVGWEGEAGATRGSGQVSAKELELLQQNLEELKAQRNELEIKLSALERGISLRSEEGRSSSEIEEDLAVERESEEELSKDRDALELALRTLEELSKAIRREFAPALNVRAAKILSCITKGRYSQVRISPDLEMSVIHPDTKCETRIETLSGGTLDQCYFALRVAVAEVITKKEEFPLFLDDPFIQYDLERLEGVMEVLGNLAEKHQVLLFSCHGREEEVARKLGIKCNVIRLDSL